jgi:hypothetical protein
VGLSDIFNSFGDPRNAVRGGGYELSKNYLQQEQMQALQRRHEMFADAYEQAKNLPGEIYGDPRFAGLAAAADQVRQSADKGEVDNEKAVSGLLTEVARHKKELEDLVQQSQLTQQMGAEDTLAKHRAGLTDLYGPTEAEKWQNTLGQQTEGARRFNVQDERLREQNRTNAGWHTLAANNARTGREDTLEAAKWNNAAKALDATLSGTIKNFMASKDVMGNPTTPPEEAEQRALTMHTDDVIYLAQHLGIQVQKHPQYAVVIIAGKPYPAIEGVQRLVAEIRARGGQ